MNHSEIVSFLWGVADLIRDTFKRGKYQDIILPLNVLRRLDCVLAPTKSKVLETQAKFKGKLENLEPQLRNASGFAFYNTSRYDFEKLLADAPHLAANLRNYIAGFSPNMREVLEKFDFDNTISKLDEAGLIFQVLERFKNVDLHPDRVDNATMGTIFEELIRKFNEALNENPGEHFTPRDVVHLMVDLLLAGDEDRILKKGIVLTVCDPCCGSGGMLTITKEHITAGVRKNGDFVRGPINPEADIHLFGQEVNPETFAVCKSDLYMKSTDGRDAEHILFGSTLSNDRHTSRQFDYLIANPPYGKVANFKDGDMRIVVKDGTQEDVVVSHIFPTTRFGFRKITVDRPLRLNFQATPERIARIAEEKAFHNLAQSKKKGAAGAKEQAEGRAQQESIRLFLQGIPQTLYKDREEFLRTLKSQAKKAGLDLAAPILKAILSALSERDETAAICRDKDGNPEPDPELRDTESVPLSESIEVFFEREVKPHVPDAWIDTNKCDQRDGKVGIVGYEINFNRYFYKYAPPRPLEEIEADIRGIEQDIMRMLAEVTGRNGPEVHDA